MRTLFEVTVAVFVILSIVGYGLNLFKLVEADFEAPYKVESIRGAGVVIVPLGGIVGWMPIDDGENNEND